MTNNSQPHHPGAKKQISPVSSEPAVSPGSEQAVVKAPKGTRRRFSNAYKLRILEELDACTKPGEISALLRREGLYSSYLPEWRQQRARGELGAPGDAALAAQLDRMKRENQRLQERLRQAELILDIQEKTSEILGIRLKASQRDPDER